MSSASFDPRQAAAIYCETGEGQALGDLGLALAEAGNDDRARMRWVQARDAFLDTEATD